MTQAVPDHLDTFQTMQYFADLLSQFLASQDVVQPAEGWTWQLVYLDSNPITGTPAVVLVFIAPDRDFGYVANCAVSELVEGGQDRQYVFEGVESEGNRFVRIVLPIMMSLTHLPSTELAFKSVLTVVFAPKAEVLPLLGVDLIDLGRELGRIGLIT